jgi:hypothetical protein
MPFKIRRGRETAPPLDRPRPSRRYRPALALLEDRVVPTASLYIDY